MPPKRKRSRRNRYAPTLHFRLRPALASVKQSGWLRVPRTEGFTPLSWRARATENMAVDTRPLACTIVENTRHQIEVCTLAETQQNPIPDLVSQARERLAQELHAQVEQLEKVEQSLQELRSRHQQLEAALQQQLDALAKVELPAAPAPAAAQASLEQVLAAVRELITATLPEQVLEVLTDAAEQLGARASGV